MFTAAGGGTDLFLLLLPGGVEEALALPFLLLLHVAVAVVVDVVVAVRADHPRWTLDVRFVIVESIRSTDVRLRLFGCVVQSTRPTRTTPKPTADCRIIGRDPIAWLAIFGERNAAGPLSTNGGKR